MSFENIVWEKGKMLVICIFPFPKMFSTLSRKKIHIILATFTMLSANPFKLVQSKSLMFGTEYTFYQMTNF